MKTAAEFVAENEGYAFEDAIEARDREVAAATLRRAADLMKGTGGWRVCARRWLRDEADRVERGE